MEFLLTIRKLLQADYLASQQPLVVHSVLEEQRPQQLHLLPLNLLASVCLCKPCSDGHLHVVNVMAYTYVMWSH